jgi:hypothetical protein
MDRDVFTPCIICYRDVVPCTQRCITTYRFRPNGLKSLRVQRGSQIDASLRRDGAQMLEYQVIDQEVGR